jgi:HSP90 family molecular chaperone
VKQKSLKVMGKKITRKVIEMLRDLAEPQGKESDDDEDDDDDDGEEKEENKPELGEEEKKLILEKTEKYKTVWTLYGNHVKFGIIQDPSNRSKLSNLVRFHSTNDTDNQTSFKD